VICLVGSKALILGTVNSPTLATPQKQTVMQAKMAASSGSSRFSWDLNRAIMSGVKGLRWGRLEEGGASRAAPSMVAFKVMGSRIHGLPCNMCQARIPAM